MRWRNRTFGDDYTLYTIKYNNIPEILIGHFSYGYEKNVRKVSKNEIEYFSKNKEDVEAYITSSKYNL